MWFLVKSIDKNIKTTMKKGIKNILKEKITRINLKRVDVLKKILKSVSQNNNIINKIKIYSNFTINKNIKTGFFFCKKHKVCLFTGKRSGILKGFNYSRYKVKNLILSNKLTNVKKHNW